MQKRGLGRGLESLIPSFNQDTGAPRLLDDEQGGRLQDIPTSKIVPNPNQPRKHIDPAAFAELVGSVREHGLIQPVVVRPSGVLYELVVGERRWRAAKEAGLSTVLAIVRATNDLEALELAIIENVQRQDLNVLEEAAAYYHLIEDFDLTHQEVARRVGKSRPTISNILRMLSCPEPIKDMLWQGTISYAHARTCLSLPTDELQVRLAERIAATGMTVQQADALAQLWKNPEQPPKREPTPMQYRLVARDLSKKLAAKVKVKLLGEKGRVEIHFKSEDELQRILSMLGE